MRIGRILILFMTVAGCGKSADLGPKTVTDARAYAELPSLRRSPHQGLQTELVRLSDEKHTPLHLAAARKSEPATTMVAARPGELGAQASLREAYPALSRGMYQQQIERIDPDGDWRIGPVERELLRELVGRTTQHREKFRAALEKARDGFEIDPLAGPLVELEFFEPLELGCRMEGLTAVHHLADGDRAAALQSLACTLDAAELLSREPHVACRLLAANTRGRALRLLQVFVLHQQCDADDLQSLETRLNETLRRWPSDAHAWVGERSSGLIAYEMVRDGHYLSLVDRDEVARLEKQHMLKTTARAVTAGIDEDQFFYLQSLRQMIDGCSKPYCERVPVLASIRQELTTRESTQRYPIVAAMLLEDFEAVHLRQAEDLARCVAWSLALQIATSRRKPDDLPLNPLTGRAFVAQVRPQGVQLGDIFPDKKELIEVPLSGAGGE